LNKALVGGIVAVVIVAIFIVAFSMTTNQPRTSSQQSSGLQQNDPVDQSASEGRDISGSDQPSAGAALDKNNPKKESINEVCVGSANCFTAVVTKIVDGDTIDVRNTRIRLSLINTPEVNEPGFVEAKDFTSSLCPVGSQVLVDQDDGQLEDEYGRMLAKITCVDNRVLNAELLKSGHAGILKHYCAVSEFSGEDWTQHYGCGETQTPIGVSTECDTSYPDVCIPSPPPDLDCVDISYHRFSVLQPDPHRFDNDRDGIGCEG